MRILIIEDDHEMAAYLMKGLKEHGYTVDHAADGRDGLLLASTGDFDLLIIDRMLPHTDGLSIVKLLREQDIKSRILLLSALGQVDDRVSGLKAGADDYLAKPYAFSELLARIEVLLRRTDSEGEQSRLHVGDLEMDMIARTVKRAGKEIELKPREFRLLEYLMRHASQVVTRTMLLEGVWEYHFDPHTNVIDAQVSRLRQKIDKDFGKPMIHTIRGAGYLLRAND